MSNVLLYIVMVRNIWGNEMSCKKDKLMHDTGLQGRIKLYRTKFDLYHK